MNRKPIPPGYVIRPFTKAEYQSHHRKILKQCFIGLIFSGVVLVLGLLLTKRSMEMLLAGKWEPISLTIGVSMLASSAPLVGLLCNTIWLRTRHYLDTKAWILHSNNLIVGTLELCPKAGACILANIYINPKYRRQGLGCALIQQAAQDVQQKIYVSCAKGLIPFYTRCGFVRFSKAQVPKPLRQYMFVLSQSRS
ncbi:GNAT family N-acetyltransferase [Acaryochloris sp. IP29b_bin.148]|uniref:GNAT family N-acetyltransferase n=1 Tax=Acaryochloris sp. IP29b_bin.148 TaxID=2969218 RepID=UPI00261F12F8|nr:GNAT family N-acetyltransferase [Acaryochloris sp. IP29b_bin.148]